MSGEEKYKSFVIYNFKDNLQVIRYLIIFGVGRNLNFLSEKFLF